MTNSISSTRKSSKEINPQAKFFGAFLTGAGEIVTFHPLDTMTKRIQVSSEPWYVKGDYKLSSANLNSIIFSGTQKDSPIQKMSGLYSGVIRAGQYKIIQRTYRFGFQSLIQDMIQTAGFQPIPSAMISGAVTGTLEAAVVLPLDTLKVLSQTNNDLVKGKSTPKLLMENFGTKLYRGFTVTALRNVSGSVPLFGGKEMSCQYLQAAGVSTGIAKTVGAYVGAFLSIGCSQPLDCVKTRLQSRGFNTTESATSVARSMYKDGIHTFFKGMGLRTVVQTGKLGTVFAASQAIIDCLDESPTFEKVSKFTKF